MSVRLAQPWLLLAALPLIVAALALARSRRRRAGPDGDRTRALWPGSGRRRLWAALEVGALGLLVLALAQPQLRTSAGQPTVLAVGRSASIDRTMLGVEGAWVRASHDNPGTCPHPCRVVAFGGSAQALPASNAALAAHPLPGASAGATNIEAGVRTALGLVPHGGRVVVLSNGWQTTGDPSAAAAEARADHVTVDNVQLSDPALRYAAITQLQAPAEVHSGDPVPLQLTIRSSVDNPAVLVLARDGIGVGTKEVHLHVGDNPFLLTYTAPAPGWHSFSAQIKLFSDGMPENDKLATTVDVVGPPHVVVAGPPGNPFASVLSRLGFAVTQVGPRGLPGSAGSYASDTAVILDDLPASAIDPAQVAALSTAVRDGGLGLVVLGGPHSFSLGGYAHTPLERLLPVSSLVPGNLQRRNVAIELVLDHSGSMIDLAGGVPKIEMVHVAGTQVAKFIAGHRDDLGIIDFDIAPHILVPMQHISPGASERGVIKRIQGLQADGGTDIYAALQAGFRQLEKSPAPDKHMVLMTDGISQPENYTPLLSTMDHDHIAVSTVALGTDADKSLLHTVAKATGGNYYYTNNAHDLPNIFAKETRFDVKPVREKGRVGVAAGSDSPVVRSLAGRRLPALSGNVVTNLKDGAQADLLAEGSGSQVDPALAQWQDGAGRVVAWTPGFGSPWAGAWTNQTGLWNDLVRWADRGVSTAPLVPTVVPGVPLTLQIDLAQSGAAAFGVSAITGSLVSDTGVTYPVDFSRVGPSLYTATLPQLAEGVYHFSLDARGVRDLTSSGLIAIPYSEEYLPRLPADTPLGQLAALTGGRALAATATGTLSGGTWLGLWWVLALASTVLFLAGAFGRLLERPADGADDYTRTSPAARAGSDSRSSTSTSVGART